MKKVLSTIVIGSVLSAMVVSADYEKLVGGNKIENSVMPISFQTREIPLIEDMSYSSSEELNYIPLELENGATSRSIMPFPYYGDEDVYIESERDIIIRNNNIKIDYDYNNKTYFTSKIELKNIVIPKDVLDDSKKIYFLIEEGYNYRNYYAKDMLMESSRDDFAMVSEKYNFKVVDYIDGKEEFIFKNEDLLKEFNFDMNYNVQIRLVAELNNGEIIDLSNVGYLNIGSKENVLRNLINNGNYQSYYYYNNNGIDEYLEKLSENIDRNVFLRKLEDVKKTILKQTNENKEDIGSIINSIKLESDFEKVVGSYKEKVELMELLNTVGSGIDNKITKLKTFNFIDTLFR